MTETWCRGLGVGWEVLAGCSGAPKRWCPACERGAAFDFASYTTLTSSATAKPLPTSSNSSADTGTNWAEAGGFA